MGLFGTKKYRNCQPREDGTYECKAYKPGKKGEKQVTAILIGQPANNCKIVPVYKDGNPDDINDLREDMEMDIKQNCSPRSG